MKTIKIKNKKWFIVGVFLFFTSAFMFFTSYYYDGDNGRVTTLFDIPVLGDILRVGLLIFSVSIIMFSWGIKNRFTKIGEIIASIFDDIYNHKK